MLFNTGYHNEHHAIPNVAWTQLPVLKHRAPEVFTSTATKSYFAHSLDHMRGDFTSSRHNPLQDEDVTERCGGQA